MKKLLFLMTLACSLMTSLVWADVDYKIVGYQGDLTIYEDNSADFIQTIDYEFDSTYNGQRVTLGEAGKMPLGFKIDKHPIVQAYVNNQERTTRSEFTDLGDGYEIKVYNGGQAGDKVKLVLHWRLHNLLFLYTDVAELNWIPISDWDQTLFNVRMTVKTAQAAAPSQLWVHTGYLKKQAKVTQLDQGYQVDLDRVDSKLELHGYWDAGLITTSQGAGQGKAEILALEQRIARRNSLLQLLFFIILPALLAVLLLISCLFYLRVNRALNPYGKLDKKRRLYEMPADLAPLLLSDYIYNRSLKDLSPFGQAKVYDAKLSFERLLQASLLDLIDRKALAVEGQGDQALITIVDEERIDDFEAAFLEMAFSKQKTKPIKNLFSDYSFDKDIVKKYRKTYKGAELERQLNRVGNQFKGKFQQGLATISELVSAKTSSAQWPPNYRDLSKQEKRRFNHIFTLAGLTMLISLLAGVTLAIMAGFVPTLLLYLLLFLLSLFLILIYHDKNTRYREIGVLTADGQARVQEWTSFTNMMRDIKKFDKVDMEGLIVWNRMLVYATLFGYAKQVEDYMKVNKIQLADPSLFVVNHQVGFLLGARTSQLVSASQSASTASNFSVSSGGSSGGGFSGGGGGGGGGAF